MEKSDFKHEYHGEKFGTDEEHTLWMSLLDGDARDESRRQRGQGYRDGFGYPS